MNTRTKNESGNASESRARPSRAVPKPGRQGMGCSIKKPSTLGAGRKLNASRRDHSATDPHPVSRGEQIITVQQFNEACSRFKAQAVETYPDVTNPESGLCIVMRHLDRALARSGDPLAHSPEKFFVLAERAAKIAGVKPRTASLQEGRRNAPH